MSSSFWNSPKDWSSGDLTSEMIQRQIDYIMSDEYQEAQRKAYEEGVKYNQYLSHLFKLCIARIEGLPCIECKRIEKNRQELMRICSDLHSNP